MNMHKSNKTNKTNETNMNTGDDIAELLDHQVVEVPPELDDRIRNMARDELKQDNNLVTPAKPWASRYAPFFATAAVMLLAVALVPTLITESAKSTSQPKAVASAAQSSNKNADIEADVAELVIPSVAQSPSTLAPVNKAAPAPVGGSAGASSEETVARSDVSRKMSNELTVEPVDVAPSAVSSLSEQDSSLSALSKQQLDSVVALADSDVDYRAKQDSWLAELDRLFQADDKPTFITELALFKKRHPAVDLRKHLPAAALVFDASSSAQDK